MSADGLQTRLVRPYGHRLLHMREGGALNHKPKSRCWLVCVTASIFSLSACGIGECSKYASDYSCSYVENKAEYEVWYWRSLQDDNEADEKLGGRAIGLRMCENNARAFAASISEEFNYQAYVCVLLDEGRRMEKHRLLS